MSDPQKEFPEIDRLTTCPDCENPVTTQWVNQKVTFIHRGEDRTCEARVLESTCTSCSFCFTEADAEEPRASAIAAAKDADRKVHELRCWPHPFQAVVDGTKTHEVRKNDRHFEIGDVLYLREFDPCRGCWAGYMLEGVPEMDHFVCPVCQGTGGDYTGREDWVKVTFLTRPGSFGMDDAHCVMSIRRFMPPV